MSKSRLLLIWSSVIGASLTLIGFGGIFLAHLVYPDSNLLGGWALIFGPMNWLGVLISLISLVAWVVAGLRGLWHRKVTTKYPDRFEKVSTLIAVSLLITSIALPFIVLRLSGDGWVPIERLPATTKQMPARNLTDHDIPLLSRFRDLNHLDFHHGCAVEKARITDEGLARLAKLDLPKLETLVLGYCESITDAGLAYVGQMHTVRELMLMGSSQITDAGLLKLLTMKRLTYLDLRGCPGITDQGLEYLATKTNWKEILLGGCPNVTSAGVARLRDSLPSAKVEKDDVEWSWSKCSDPA